MQPSDLTAVFRDLSEENAKLMLAIWAARDDEAKLEELVALVPKTEAYVRQLYSSPYDSYDWRRTVALHALDVLAETHGVEALEVSAAVEVNDSEILEIEGAILAEYLNTGDPYTSTVLYLPVRDELLISSYGDFLENFEREALEAEQEATG